MEIPESHTSRHMRCSDFVVSGHAVQSCLVVSDSPEACSLTRRLTRDLGEVTMEVAFDNNYVRYSVKCVVSGHAW